MTVTSLPIQLVVFDLMGTLAVDGGRVERAYDRALAEAGLPPGSREFTIAKRRIEQLRGRPTLVVLTDVLGDPVRAEESTWAFDDTILAEAASIAPIAGAERTLDQVRERGVLVAVTTSFSPDVRKRLLFNLGWSNTFSAALSAHGRRRGHPAPDLLLEAILDLGIDSVAQVAVVGDTVADLEAGNRAGAGLVVGVLTGSHDRATLSQAPHTHLLESVAELPQLLVDPRTEGHRRRSDR